MFSSLLYNILCFSSCDTIFQGAFITNFIYYTLVLINSLVQEFTYNLSDTIKSYLYSSIN